MIAEQPKLDTKEVIKVSHISKVFKSKKIQTIALNGVSLSVKKGDFISIEGTSGCGKSTLLSILSLLDKPTSGEYIISDIDVNNIAESEKLRVRNQYMGIVFQTFNLIPTLTVLENVVLPTTFYSNPEKNDYKAKALQILSRVGLGDRLDHYPNQLSGGQQQRVSIARALINDPEVLFADEPTGNLDSDNAMAVIELFKELNEDGQTILMVTHDEKLASLAKRNLKMSDGKLL